MPAPSTRFCTQRSNVTLYTLLYIKPLFIFSSSVKKLEQFIQLEKKKKKKQIISKPGMKIKVKANQRMQVPGLKEKKICLCSLFSVFMTEVSKLTYLYMCFLILWSTLEGWWFKCLHVWVYIYLWGWMSGYVWIHTSILG
jgi:hypothetical protein